MDFDFLPKLPKPDLDDRTFKNLVDECILRIPRYCPEWTNYNPNDPGITLFFLPDRGRPAKTLLTRKGDRVCC